MGLLMPRLTQDGKLTRPFRRAAASFNHALQRLTLGSSGDMKRQGGVALAVIGLALVIGCVRTTHVKVRQTGETQEVDLVRRWHGVTIGPCGFVTGAYANYSIRLNGPGPIYPIDQIEFLNEKGEPELA
jgi:hypothetical protein